MVISALFQASVTAIVAAWWSHKKNLFLKGELVIGELRVDWSTFKVSLPASQVSLDFTRIKPRRDQYIMQSDSVWFPLYYRPLSGAQTFN